MRSFFISPSKVFVEIHRKLPGLTTLGVLYVITYYVLYGRKFSRLGFPSFISPFSRVKDESKVNVGNGFYFRAFGQISGSLVAGENVRFGIGCSVFGKVEIGDNVMIAPGVVLAGGNHGIAREAGHMMFQACPQSLGIRIRDDVWLGANTTVLDGVSIGQGCIIGAGSVVTRDTEPYGVYAGNPARLIRYR